MKYATLTLFLSLAISLPLLAGAQALQPLGGDQTDPIIIRTEPSRPIPNQPVTVIIESYATDLNRSDISWFLNNALVQEGVGKKTFSFAAGKSGSLSSILIIIKTSEGAVIQKTFDVRPASVSLLWEAVSYTPPFYKGKALYPYQGTVKVVALPDIVTENGGKINAKNLVYTWKIDGTTSGDQSGYGKNFIVFTGRIPLRSTKVDVEAETLDKTRVATGSTTITPQSPELLFYEDSPVYGVLYNRALTGTVALEHEEIKLAAAPYFLGVNERQGTGLVFDWQLNNQDAGAGTTKDSLAFRYSAGGVGQALVALQVSNPARIFQVASNNLSLNFGQGGTTGF